MNCCPNWSLVRSALRFPGPHAVLTAAVAVTTAACGPATDGDLPRDPAVTVGVLDNGLRYYVRANRRPENRAELRLIVDAGSILEDDDQLGLAHFAEHMAFNGTARFPKSEIVDYLERIGMRFGADVNASTSFDQTVYQLTVPTDSVEVMRTAFAILEDWAGAVSFEDDEIERERGVILEEWRLGRGAWSRIADQQFPVLFQGAHYADRVPIGDPEIIRTFEPETLRRFYRDWYRPDLMGIVAVGDFDPAVIESLIHEHFSALPTPQTPRPRPSFDVPGHAEPLYTIATDPEETWTTAAVYYKRPARTIRTVDDYRTRIVERLFSSIVNDRLFEIQQQPDAPFLYASIGQNRFVRPLETWLLVAGVPDGTAAAGIEALLTEVERVRRHGITSTELARHKTLVLRRMQRTYDERDKTRSTTLVGEYVRHFLEAEPFPGIEEEYQLYQDVMPGIRLDEVNEVARLLLVDRNRVALVSAPSSQPVPDHARLSEVFASVATAEVTPYVDDIGPEHLLPTTPAPGSIVSETRFDSLGVWDWQLSNGARVILKPTDFQDDEITMQAWSPGGSSLAEDEDFVAAATATSIVSVSGVGEADAVALQKLLAGKAVTVGPYVAHLSEGLSGWGSPKDVETMFQLTHLYFTAPRRDSTAYLTFQLQQREMLRNRDLDPEVAYYDTLNAVLTRHHLRTRPFTAETFAAMDLDRSLAFYRDRFADAGDFTFVIVGNLEVDSLRPLVETYLASLPSLERTESWVDRGIGPPEGVVTRDVRRGLEPKSQTRLVFHGPFDGSNENRQRLATLSAVLNIRLRESLREELGGTYGASVGASVERIPRSSYQVSISFGADPDRATEVLARAFEEIRAIQSTGPTADELAKVREIQIRARETTVRENGYWLNRLLDRAQRGVPLDQAVNYEELVRSVTGQQVRDAARRWLRENRYVRVTLLPADG